MSEIPPLMQVKNLAVSYAAGSRAGRRTHRLRAVRNASFTLQEGRIFGLVGESGCGKTTLAKALAGLVEAESGEVLYRSQPIKGMAQPLRRKTRREVQYISQDPAASLSPRRTLWQSLVEPLQLYRIGGRAEHPERITRVLQIVDLNPELLARYPHELSGGQQQRVVMARALLAEPRLIIADEPLSSLDVSGQARIITLIRRVQQEFGVAFMLISHDLAVIRQLADCVGVMYLGEMVELSPSHQLFRNPAHPYTSALLDASATALEMPGLPISLLGGDTPSPLTPPPGCVFHTRCPRVMTQCRSTPPAEVAIPAPGKSQTDHLVRCHLWTS